MMLDSRVYNDLEINGRVTVAEVTRASSISQIAHDVLKQAPSRFALIGLSMGGIIAFEIWRVAPERISHIGLIDTTPYAESLTRREMRAEQIAAVASGKLHEVIVNSMQPRYLAKRRQDDPRLRESIINQALSLGPEVFQRQSLALRDRVDSTATLATIDCPSLVLCGREDQLCPVDYHLTMAAALPHADLVVLADCGHLAVMENPIAVSSAINHLMQRHD